MTPHRWTFAGSAIVPMTAGLALLAGPTTARAQTESQSMHWASPLGGVFQTPSNWQEDSVPGTEDHAYFGSAINPYTVQFNDDAANLFLGVSGEITFDLGHHTYTLTQTSDLQPFTPSLSVGNAQNAAKLTLKGGTLNTVNAGIALNSSTGAVTVDGADALWTNSGLIQVENNGTLNVINGATVDGGETLGLLGFTSALNVNTGGTVAVSTLDVTGGTVRLDGGTIKMNALNFNPTSATFDFQKGTLEFTTDQRIDAYSSPIGGVLDPTSSGTIHLNTGQTLTIDGTAEVQAPFTIDGGTLKADRISLGSDLTFNSGTLQYNGDYDFNSDSTIQTVLNNNTIRTGQSVVIDGALTNGIRNLIVDGGTLTIGRWGNDVGPIDLAIPQMMSSGTFNMTQGDLLIGSIPIFSSPVRQLHVNIDHTVNLVGTTQVFNGNSLSAGTLNLDIGSVLIPAFGGKITAGAIENHGGWIDVGPGGTLELTGSQTTTAENPLPLSPSASPIFSVRPGGTLRIDGDLTLDTPAIIFGAYNSEMSPWSVFGGGVLDIQGPLTLNSNANLLMIYRNDTLVGAGTLRTAGIINNGGQVRLQSGTLEFTTDQTIDSSGIIDQFARSTIGNNIGGLTPDKTLIIDGTATLNTPVAINGGTFAAAALVNPNNLTFNSGTLKFLGNHAIESGGVIDNLTNLSQDGVVAGKHLAIGGTATLNMPVAINGGTLSVGDLANTSNLQFNSGTLEFCSNGDISAGSTVETLFGASSAGVTQNQTLALTGTGALFTALKVNGGRLVIDAPSFANTSDGTIQVVNGGTASLSSSRFSFFYAPTDHANAEILNQGVIHVTDSTLNLGRPLNLETDATVMLPGIDHWSNQGTIIAENATINLGGRFTTADIGTIQRTGGTVNLTGLLYNQNTTLTLNAATGSWNLAGGEIYGGTILLADGSQLILADTGGTLENVNIQGDLNVGQGSTLAGVTALAGNLTNDGSLNPGITGNTVEDPDVDGDSSPQSSPPAQQMGFSSSLMATAFLSAQTSDRLLQINGNYTQNSSGQLVIDLKSDGVNQLAVSGAANLAGGLQINTLNGPALSVGASYNILSANSISGAFNQVLGAQLAGGDLSFSLDYSDGNLSLILLKTGDLNGDGFVGIDDLNLALAHWGSDVAAGVWGQGDLSGDGFVGMDDLNPILSYWGQGQAPSIAQINAMLTAMGKAASVPEPGTFLLGVGSMMILMRRRRRI